MVDKDKGGSLSAEEVSAEVVFGGIQDISMVVTYYSIQATRHVCTWMIVTTGKHV